MKQIFCGCVQSDEEEQVNAQGSQGSEEGGDDGQNQEVVQEGNQQENGEQENDGEQKKDQEEEKQEKEEEEKEKKEGKKKEKGKRKGKGKQKKVIRTEQQKAQIRKKREQAKLRKQKKMQQQKECKYYKQMAQKIYNYFDALYTIGKKGYTLFFTIVTYTQIKQISDIPILSIISFIAAFAFNLYVIFCMKYIQRPGKKQEKKRQRAKRLKAILSISKILNGQKLVKLINQDCDCCGLEDNQVKRENEGTSSTLINVGNGQIKKGQGKGKGQRQKISLERYSLINNIGMLLLQDFLQAAYIFMVMRMSSSFYNYSVAGCVVVSASALNGAGNIMVQVTKLQNKKPPVLDPPSNPPPNPPLRVPTPPGPKPPGDKKNGKLNLPNIDETESKVASDHGEHNSVHNSQSINEINPNSSVLVTKRSLQIVHQKE